MRTARLGRTIVAVAQGEEPCFTKEGNAIQYHQEHRQQSASLEDIAASTYITKEGIFTEDNRTPANYKTKKEQKQTHPKYNITDFLTTSIELDQETQIAIIRGSQVKIAYPRSIAEKFPELKAEHPAIDEQHRKNMLNALGKGYWAARRAITNFLEEDYCWDDRFFAFLKDQFTIWVKGKNKHQTPFDTQARLKAFCDERSKTQDIICSIPEQSFYGRRELAHRIEKETGELVHVFRHIPYIAVTVPKRDTQACMRACAQVTERQAMHARSPAIVREGYFSFIPELMAEIVGSPRQRTSQGTLWHLELIGAYEALEHAAGQGVRIVIADTGADINHQEITHLFDPRDAGYNFVSNSPNIRDGDGHGTHVAGLVGGKTVGIARNAQVYAAKVLSDEGYGSEASVVRGMEYAIGKKAHLLSMSLGSPNRSAMEAAAVAALRKNNIAIIAAAGNEGFGASYPASYDGVISVAAVNRKKEHADFSNIHNTVDISAPGVNVYSSVPGGGYKAFSGTSMATPLVSGSAALLLSATPSNPDELERRLCKAAEHLGSSSDRNNRAKYGAGLVRPDRVLKQGGEWYERFRKWL